MKVNTNNLKTYISLILGFFIITYYIWVRFIRERFPRDIPFNLSLFSLLLILVIIISFLLILKQIFKPQPSLLSEIMMPLLTKIYQPIFSVDIFIKKNNHIKQFIFILSKNLTTISILRFPQFVHLYYVFFIIPRIILLIMFYIDIFYLHKLYLSYIFIFISLIPSGISYFIYLMKYFLEQYIIFLETWYEVKILSTNPDPELDYAFDIDGDGIDDFTISSFLYYQYASSRSWFKYQCCITWDLVHKYYSNIHSMSQLTIDQKKFLEQGFHALIQGVINMYNITQDYASIFKLYESEMKKINVIIVILYLIAWLYILLVSMHTFHLTDLESIFLQVFQDYIEPFSQISINI